MRSSCEFLGQLLAWSQFYRPNFFANTPDILHEYLAAGRPAGVRGPARPGGDAVARRMGSTRVRALRECARARGQRGVPRLGEVRAQATDARRAAAAARAAAERDPAASPRCSGSRTSGCSRPTSDYVFAYVKVGETWPSPSTSTRTSPGRTSSSSRRARGFPEEFPVRDLLTGERYRGASAATTSVSAPARAHVIEARRRLHRAGAVEAHERTRPLVRVQPALVQDGGLLRDPHARVLRRQRRRVGRLPRACSRSSTTCSGSASTASGCCRSTPRRSATAATTSPTSTGSTRTTARSRTSARFVEAGTSAGSASSSTWS